MKAKLLKKIRARFDWYYKPNGDPVLVDHKLQTNTLIGVKYAMKLDNYSSQDQLLSSLQEISIDEYLKRLLFIRLLEPLNLSYMKNYSYRKTRRWWSKKNGKRRVPNLIK